MSYARILVTVAMLVSAGCQPKVVNPEVHDRFEVLDVDKATFYAALDDYLRASNLKASDCGWHSEIYKKDVHCRSIAIEGAELRVSDIGNVSHPQDGLRTISVSAFASGDTNRAQSLTQRLYSSGPFVRHLRMVETAPKAPAPSSP